MQIEAYPGKPIKLVITPLNELNCTTVDKIQILGSSYYNICAGNNITDSVVRKVIIIITIMIQCITIFLNSTEF